MKISTVTDKICSFPLLKRNSTDNAVKNNTKTPSFKGIFIEKNVRLGDVALRSRSANFLPKDALLLNEIASKYPNQDCFIRSGYGNFPRLEYRERPPEVAQFYENSAKYYQQNVVPDDKEYPSVPLIIYPNSNLNRFIGMTSYISLNPSLPYTVKAGYEVHKQMMEKKFQIMDVVGRVDNVDLGEQSVMEKAHSAIEDVETAVTRYLLECSYVALTDKVSSKQLYESLYPKVQSRLSAKRRLDLTTSTAKLPVLDESVGSDRTDICETAMERYPNLEENKNRIKELVKYMTEHGIILG